MPVGPKIVEAIKTIVFAAIALLTIAMPVLMWAGMPWLAALGLLLFVLTTALMLSWCVASIDSALQTHSYGTMVSSVFSIAGVATCLFAIVHWSVYLLDRTSYTYDLALLNAEAIDAPIKLRNDLRRDDGLIVGLIALRGEFFAQEATTPQGWRVYRLSNDIAFARQSETIFAPGGPPGTLHHVLFIVSGEEIDVPTQGQLHTNTRGSIGVKLAEARDLSELRAAADEMLTLLLSERKDRLFDLRARLAGQVDLGIWTFVFYSASSIVGADTSPVSPHSTLTRAIKYMELVVGILILSFGVGFVGKEVLRKH